LRKQYWAALFFLLVGVFLIYLPSLNNGFTNWDDPVYLLDNTDVQEFSLAGVKNIFLSFSKKYYHYHPLTILSFAIEYHISGYHPFSYHLTNLIFHLLNTALCYGVIFLITKNHICALLVALLFGFHPMRVESVAWVTGRKDVLFAFFYLSSLQFYLIYCEKEKIKKVFFWFSLGLFICSLLSKPAAISLPFILCLLDVYKGRFTIKTFVLEKPLFFILSLCYGMIVLYDLAQPFDNPFPLEYRFLLADKILLACHSFFMYVGKCIWPVNLSGFYPFPEKINGLLPAMYYLSGFLFCCALWIAVKYVRKDKEIFFGIMFFATTIFFNLPVFDVGYVVIADRFTYLPYMGLFFIFAVVMQRTFQKQKHPFGYKHTFIGLALVVYFSFLTVQTSLRCRVWQNSETFWSDVIKKFPNTPMAYYNRGNHYFDSNRLELAIQDYDQTLRLYPHSFGAFNNRGNAYTLKGNFHRALADYDQALILKPGHRASRLNKAAVYYHVGKWDQAIQEYKQVLTLDPLNPTALDGIRKAVAKNGFKP